MRRLSVVLVVLLALSVAFADDVAELEKSFVRLAREATAKTVGIKSFIKDMGRYGMGSGAIVSPDGYILTCDHVVPDADEIEVILPDGRRFKAKRVATCTKNDFALLKIEAEGLPFFELGDSDELKVGDWVAALGHPGGLRDDAQPTFAVGRIAGLKKKLFAMMQKFYPDAIQTDIPISPGNSGGPLVDIKGRLIGINGAVMPIETRSYAVPINRIKEVLDKMKKGEDIEGVFPQNIMDVIKEMSKDLGPETIQKILKRLTPNMDELLEQLKDTLDDMDLDKMFDELKKRSSDEDLDKMFEELEKMLKTEDTQKLVDKFLKEFMKPKEGEDPFKQMRKMMEEFMKDEDMKKLMEEFMKGWGSEDFQKEMEKMMEEMFGKRPVEEEKEVTKEGERPKREAFLGVQVETLTSEALKYQLGIDGGLMVLEVLEGSPAERAGLRRNDLILAIDGKPIKSVSDMLEVFEKAKPGQVMKFTVLQEGKKRELTATLGKRPEEKNK